MTFATLVSFNFINFDLILLQRSVYVFVRKVDSYSVWILCREPVRMPHHAAGNHSQYVQYVLPTLPPSDSSIHPSIHPSMSWSLNTCIYVFTLSRWNTRRSVYRQERTQWNSESLSTRHPTGTSPLPPPPIRHTLPSSLPPIYHTFHSSYPPFLSPFHLFLSVWTALCICRYACVCACVRVCVLCQASAGCIFMICL